MPLSTMTNVPRVETTPMHLYWRPKDEEVLRGAVMQFGISDWEAVARKVGNDKSATECMRKWSEILSGAAHSKEPKKGTWSPEEDELLRQLMEAMPHRNWGDVAALIPGRSAKQCRERWCYNLDPSIKKDIWTEDEDKILLLNQQKLGNRWAFIASMLPGRTENAVKTRFKSIMRAKKREWLPMEDKTIMEMHRQIGSKWERIAEKLPNRTKNAVRTRYRQLVKEIRGIEDAPNEFGNYGKRAAILRKCNELQKSLEVEKLLLQLGDHCISDAQKTQEQQQQQTQQQPFTPFQVKAEDPREQSENKMMNENHQYNMNQLSGLPMSKKPAPPLRSRRGSKRERYPGDDQPGVPDLASAGYAQTASKPPLASGPLPPLPLQHHDIANMSNNNNNALPRYSGYMPQQSNMASANFLANNNYASSQSLSAMVSTGNLSIDQSTGVVGHPNTNRGDPTTHNNQVNFQNIVQQLQASKAFSQTPVAAPGMIDNSRLWAVAAAADSLEQARTTSPVAPPLASFPNPPRLNVTTSKVSNAPTAQGMGLQRNANFFNQTISPQQQQAFRHQRAMSCNSGIPIMMSRQNPPQKKRRPSMPESDFVAVDSLRHIASSPALGDIMSIPTGPTQISGKVDNK